MGRQLAIFSIIEEIELDYTMSIHIYIYIVRD